MHIHVYIYVYMYMLYIHIHASHRSRNVGLATHPSVCQRAVIPHVTRAGLVSGRG